MTKIIAQGAEAIISLSEGKIIKERKEKNYRISEIDQKLRKRRTRREGKVLKDLPVLGPNVLNVDDKSMKIEMDYIEGNRLADILEKEDYIKICRNIGKNIKILHDKNIIHGDLTTSNIILNDNKLYFIDFGLSFYSDKAEDKAVDLHLMRQALESKHYTIWEECFKEILKNYNDKDTINRLEKVESRGRNKLKSN